MAAALARVLALVCGSMSESSLLCCSGLDGRGWLTYVVEVDIVR